MFHNKIVQIVYKINICDNDEKFGVVFSSSKNAYAIYVFYLNITKYNRDTPVSRPQAKIQLL